MAPQRALRQNLRRGVLRLLLPLALALRVFGAPLAPASLCLGAALPAAIWVGGLGVVGGLGLSPAVAWARRPPLILRALRLGQVRLAHRELLRALEKEGDDVDLIAIFGATLARAGYFGDAAATFPFAAGSDWYEQQGLGDHADALRELGRGDEAAALRLGVLLRADRSATFDAQVMMEIAEDHLEAGQLGAALEAAERAVAWGPGSPLPYCTLGRVHRALGEPEAAWDALRLADRAADRQVAALELLRAQLLLDAGLHEEAFAALDSLPRGRNDNLKVWAMRAEISVQEGLPDDALLVLDHDRLRFQAAPALVEVRARALSALGRRAEAKAVVEAALEVAPARPGLRALAAGLRDAD